MIHKFFSTLALSTALSYAIDPNLIKGSQVLMIPEKEDLAPVYAATMLETGWLENLRLLWQVGLRENIEPYAQLRGTANDNPHNNTALLLQYLFPSPDGAALALNNREFFALRHLSHIQLGNVFALADSEQSPEDYLRKILVKNKRSEGAKFAKVLIDAFAEDRTQFIPNLARHCFIAYVIKTATTKQQIWDFLVAAKLLNDTTPTAHQTFITDLFQIDAYTGFKASMYRDFIEPSELEDRIKFLQVFTKHKQSLLDAGRLINYINGIRQTHAPSVATLLEPERTWENFRPSPTTLAQLSENQEHLYYLGYTYARTEKLDFIIDYGMAFYSEDKKLYAFSDCAEASLFSLLNGLLFNEDTRRPSANRLPATAQSELRAFYTKLETSSKSLAAFRAEFSQLVSNIDGLDYVKSTPSGGRYELVSTIENLRQALNYLLGADQDNADFLSFFNTSDVTYKFDEETSTADSVNITRNNAPWLTIKSSNNHTEIKNHQPDVLWGHRLSRAILEQAVESTSAPISLVFPALFEPKYTWRFIATADDATLTNDQILTVALGLPLSGTKHRMKLVNESLVSAPQTQTALSCLTGLTAKASFDDPHTMIGLIKLFSCLGHDQTKSNPLTQQCYARFEEKCKKSPIFAWVGFLLWRAPELSPLLDYPLILPESADLIETILPALVLKELFTRITDENDFFNQQRKFPQFPESRELQQKFLTTYAQLTQSSPDYKKDIAPHVIDVMLDEIDDHFDPKALTIILNFAKEQGISIPFNFMQHKFLKQAENDELVQLILDATSIDDDSSDARLSLLDSTLKAEIRLCLLDKILTKNPTILSSPDEISGSIINSLLNTCYKDFAYQVFARVKNHQPELLITKKICEMYEIPSSAHLTEQGVTYVFVYNEEERSTIGQFIADHKDGFKKLYDGKPIPNRLVDLLT
jgi:hypothetical protein